VALDATVEIAGPNGVRTIALADFHRLAGDAPERETLLAPGELILAVRLPADAKGLANNSRYLKLRERTSFAFALVSAAAALRRENRAIAKARLALRAVAARPWRVREAEALMLGQTPNVELFTRAAARALEGAKSSGDNAHKIELARQVAVRALNLEASGAPERIPALPASSFAEPAHA
jgi:xanthine dehydrogenase YagS FAD-binding subunit